MIDISTKKLIIFDADDTLRRCTVEGQPCPNRPGEWELLPGVREKIAALPDQTYFAIVSNQGGIGLGKMPREVAWQMLLELADQTMRGRGVVYMCPHSPKDGCTCRKPSPLMLYLAMDALEVKPADTLYVGDMESDREAAKRAGVDFLWAWQFFGWSSHREVTIKWDLGEGNEDAIYVRPRQAIQQVLKARMGEASAASVLGSGKLTIPVGTLLAEYEIEEGTAAQVAEMLDAEHGEHFITTAITPNRIKVCTAKPYTVGLDFFSKR